MTVVLKQSDYLRSITSVEDGAPEALPELVLAGKSNVGKSSFLNRITGRKKLASTSSNPGHTRKINIFELTLAFEGLADKRVHLADLPGYGYAKLSKRERTFLNRLIVDYVAAREELRLLCILNDIRREPSEDDIALRNVASQRDLPVLIIATKTDKVKQGERGKLAKNLAAGYGLEPGDIIMSSPKLQPGQFWSRAEPYFLEDDEI